MAGYLGASPVPQTIQKKETIIASAGQTTFNTTGYTDGNFINVFLNGVRLVNGTDYTATNNSDIVLASAASASDVLDFETFNEFQLTDQEFANSVIIENNTSEDSDGGRAGKLVYKGKQSGGEQSTLAEIQASHDGTADDQKGDLIFKTNDGSDNAAPTEAFRVDSSQNLLVGKTSADSATNGVQLLPNGISAFGRASAEPLRLNRNSDFGEILRFQKDGITSGSLGIQSTGFYVDGEAGHAGIRFAGNEISPRDNGADADNTVSLGESDKRFKDLYLSGGVVFGDASAAIVTSETLSDYEEGNCTLTWHGTGGTNDTTSSGFKYVKVGRMINVSGNTVSTTPNATGTLELQGLPFTADRNAVGAILYRNITAGSTNQHTLVAYVGANSTKIQPYWSAQNNYDRMESSDINSSGVSDMYFSVTYMTTT